MSSNLKGRKQEVPQNVPDDLEQLVFEAGKRCGWLLPETPEEVQRAENEIPDESVALPASLRSLETALQSQSARKVVSFQQGRFLARHSSNEAVENLARAAREGGTISAEVEEVMRRDRAAAETDDGDDE